MGARETDRTWEEIKGWDDAFRHLAVDSLTILSRLLLTSGQLLGSNVVLLSLAGVTHSKQFLHEGERTLNCRTAHEAKKSQVTWKLIRCYHTKQMSGEREESWVEPAQIPLWKANNLLQKTYRCDGLENYWLILISSRCGLLTAKCCGLLVYQWDPSTAAVRSILLRTERSTRCPHHVCLRSWEPVVLSLISFSPQV